MSWFHDNKFLAIFGGSVLVAAGGLGYLTMGASAKYEEESKKFTDATSTLSNLANAKPFPMEENVKLYEARKESVKKEIDKLQGKLAAIKLKTERPEEVPPTTFQDELKKSVVKVTAKAAEVDATLPKDFYLSFLSYKDKPPLSNAAAAALLKELHAMELVSDLLLQAKGVKIEDWSRDALPEESTAPASTSKNTPKTEKKHLIRKAPFFIKFVTSQSHFISVLNGLAGHDKQIFVVRNIHVANTEEKSPPKVKAGGPAPGQGPNTPPAADTGLETVFGQEKVIVDMDVDIVDVADPDAPATTTPAKSNPKSK
jgi:hypothetical protein